MKLFTKKMPSNWFLIVVISLGSCKTSPQQNSNQGSSKLFDVASPSDGVVLSKENALTELRNRREGLSDKIKDVLGHGQMFYNGGSDQKADGAGARFSTSCGMMADNEFGCFRSSESQSASTIKQAQIAPSKDARLNDLITLMYEVSENSAKQDGTQAGFYSQIEVRTGVTLTGQITGQNLNKTNCLSVEGKDDQYRMSFLFYDCGDSFYGRSARKGSLVSLRTFWGIEKM